MQNLLYLVKQIFFPYEEKLSQPHPQMKKEGEREIVKNIWRVSDKENAKKIKGN